jgi:predicted Zn-dependent peptidase
LFGNKSTFLTELNSADIKKLTPEQLINSFKDVQTYGVKVNYVGTIAHADVKKTIIEEIKFGTISKPALSKIKYEMKGFDSKKVYFLNDKKAVQSQVLFLVEGLPMSPNMMGEAAAFNLYFGGDMSSLVFQEIREFRSLAYSTTARYQIAEKQGDKNLFFGYVGCQGDKTPEAVDVMFDLITKMPIKKEREAAIRAALISEAKTSKPGFRTLISKVEDWERMGFTQDPNMSLLPYYTDLTFEQINEFYKNHIAGKNMQLIVVGNKKKFDLKTIKKYGQFIELKTNQVVRN